MSRRDRVPLTAWLVDLDIDRVDYVPAGANGEADIVLYKSHTEVTPDSTEEAPVATEDLSALQDAIDAAVSKAVEDTTAIFAAQYEQEAAEFAALTDGDGDQVEKALAELPADAREAIEKDRQRTAALEEQVQKMQDAEVERVLKSKAEGYELVGSVDEIVPVLKAVAADEDLLAGFEKLLAQAQARISEGALFAERGGVAVPATDAESAIEKAAEGSDPQALYDAIKANPDLYEDYKRERAARVPYSVE